MQRSGGKTVSDDTAEQVGNHTEYAENASKNAHLHIGEVIGFPIYIVIVKTEIRQPVDDRAAECDNQDCQKVFGHFFAQAYLCK